jgi:tetratricopeptide (TPR) repeat protein
MMDCPYPGTRPFGRADRDLLFGRAADIAVLADMWRANRLTIAVGPVASGKTSLLHAGLFPLMLGTRLDVLPPGRVSYGSVFPVAALPDHNWYTLALLRSWSPGDEVTRLAGLTIVDFIKRRIGGHERTILAAIDHVEDLLVQTGPRIEARDQFLAELSEALDTEPRLHVLLLARDEALSLICEALGGGARHHLRALTRQGAIEAVREPVIVAGRKFADGAAERLVTSLQTSRIVSPDGQERNVSTDYVEPSLLQVACGRLWDNLPAGGETITAGDLRRYGDVDSALAEYCGRVVSAVADHHEIPAAGLRSWLVGTFVTEIGTRASVYEGPAKTARMPNAVVHELVDRHLLSVEQRSGSRWYELLSDRLIDPLRQAADERLPQTRPEDYREAAERALTLGELDVAKRYAQEVLDNAPGNGHRLRAEAESLLGNVAYERDNFEEAETYYRMAASLFEAARDTSAVARELAAVGRTLLAQGRVLEAVIQLRAAVDRLPGDLVLQTELGLALWQLGDGRAAVAVLTAVLAVDGGNPAALRARGEILADLGDARRAVADLGRVALHDQPAARAARGLALAELGDEPAASRDIDEAMYKAPRNGPVLWYAARARALGGHPGDAERLARQAVDAADPALPQPQLERALQLAGRKHKEP